MPLPIGPDDCPSIPGESKPGATTILLIDATYGSAARAAVQKNLITGHTENFGPPGHEDDFTFEITEAKIVIVDRDTIEEDPDAPLTGVGTSNLCAGIAVWYTVTRN